jgi:HEAT repeat protein
MLMIAFRFLTPFLVYVLFGLSADTVRPADPPKKDDRQAQLDLIDELAPHPDLEWLRRAKVPTDDAGLIKFLNGLRGAEPDPAEVDRLVTQLRTGTDAEQAAAAKKLAEIGPVAVPGLRRHRLDPDAGAARVRACLEKIEEAFDKPLARPAMRRLVWRRAPGAAEALLGYVPFAYDPDAELDAWYGLDELAGKDLKTLAVLAGALADRQPARRAVAACILGRRGDVTQKKAVAGLLTDPSPDVRLRAAQGLLAGHNTAGVPILIDLLADAEIEIRWQAEELLRWLAVDAAPDALIGAGDPKAIAAAQAAWKKWWHDQGEKADVAAAEQEPRRPMLLLAYDRKGGRAWVVGCDGVTRHEWTGLARLADAQYVPGGSVLTLHEQPVREKPLLAERDLSGKPLWQYDDMRDPASIQRLANGRVFVAERQPVEPKFWYQVLAATGRKVVETTSERQLPFALSLRQMADGRVLAWVPSNIVDRNIMSLYAYDPETATRKNLHLRRGLNLVGRVQVEGTRDGNLFSGLRGDLVDWEIVEVDSDGYQFWWYRLKDAIHASRLRSGNTIACVANRMVEVSLDKRMIGDVPCDHELDAARPNLGLIRIGFDFGRAGLDLDGDLGAWVRRLASPSARIRRLALDRLANFGPEAAGLIPTIRQFTADPDESVRASAAQVLRAAGTETVPALLDKVKQSEPDRRCEAIAKISQFHRYPGVLEAVIAATRDDDRKVRLVAVSALTSRINDPQIRTTYSHWPSPWLWAADRVVPAAVAATGDKDKDIRSLAFLALDALGPAAKSAAPQLLDAWGGADFESRCGVLVVLGAMGPVDHRIYRLLRETLDDSKDPTIRNAAIQGLKAFGSPAKPAVDKLIEVFHDPGTEDAQWAIRIQNSCIAALAQISPTDPRAIRLFVRVLSDERIAPSPRGTVEALLPTMGWTAAAESLPVLDRLAKLNRKTPNEFADTARRIRISLQLKQ